MDSNADIRIDPAAAKAKVDAGDAIILDVVTSESWAGMHQAIKGAIRISPEVFGDRYEELPRSRGIIAYCT